MLETSNSKHAAEGKKDGVLKINLVLLIILILLFNAQRISALISFLSLSSYYVHGCDRKLFLQITVNLLVFYRCKDLTVEFEGSDV